MLRDILTQLFLDVVDTSVLYKNKELYWLWTQEGVSSAFFVVLRLLTALIWMASRTRFHRSLLLLIEEYQPENRCSHLLLHRNWLTVGYYVKHNCCDRILIFNIQVSRFLMSWHSCKCCMWPLRSVSSVKFASNYSWRPSGVSCICHLLISMIKWPQHIIVCASSFIAFWECRTPSTRRQMSCGLLITEKHLHNNLTCAFRWTSAFLMNPWDTPHHFPTKSFHFLTWQRSFFLAFLDRAYL